MSYNTWLKTLFIFEKKNKFEFFNFSKLNFWFPPFVSRHIHVSLTCAIEILGACENGSTLSGTLQIIGSISQWHNLSLFNKKERLSLNNADALQPDRDSNKINSLHGLRKSWSFATNQIRAPYPELFLHPTRYSHYYHMLTRSKSTKSRKLLLLKALNIFGFVTRTRKQFQWMATKWCGLTHNAFSMNAINLFHLISRLS